MAAPNPHRGEVSLVAGDVVYTLRVSTNAIAIAEQVLGCGADEITEGLRPGAFRLGTLRALLFAALQGKHPGVSLDDAGDIIDAVGVGAVLDKVNETIRLSFPEAKPGNPPRASRGGTGRKR